MEPFPGDIQSASFDELANQLLMEGSERSPSYLHGGVCGIYAGAGAVYPEDCLAASAQALELDIQGELAESCLRLARASLAALQDEEFAFHLLLPDDDVDVDQRVQALAEWCRGFLAAYALVISQAPAGGLDNDTGESLGDIAAISEATIDAEADDEESEKYLFEVSEYLRFAILNLFASRLEANASDPGGTVGGDS